MVPTLGEKLDIRFITHNKKDSTGICFIGERRFSEFLAQYLSPKPGLIQTLDGKTVGKHQGLAYYTIGQRKGLGIGGLQCAADDPWYVVEKNAKSNVLVVAQGHNHPALFKLTLTCSQIHWITPPFPELPYPCTAKTRYRQVDQQCHLTPGTTKDSLEVHFKVPQRAITPGQSIVFYQNQQCLGGGIIDS